jgi:ATP/ADP translocase
MLSDVARDEPLQSLLLPFAAFLALITAIIHFCKESLQPEPPQFTLMEETAAEAISQRRDYADG